MTSLPEVHCPLCNQTVQVGLPQQTTILALLNSPDTTLDEEIESKRRQKRRSLRCSQGHRFYVYFEY